MNMDSPAAALMGLGPSGLTPLPLAQDGLGISTGFPGAPSVQDGHTSKNPQKERHDRLKEIAEILKKKSQPKGVSRSNVQTVAKVHGFDHYYDEDEPDILQLAGKEYVVVDVVWGSNESNVAEKVRLKLNDPAAGEDEIVQKNASRVLTSNLTEDSNERLPWHDLTDFSANLEYLSELERVSTGSGTSCFKIIDNLYDTFQKIWIEEKKRMKWRHDFHHLCQSNVGAPKKDADRRLGMTTRYWTRGRNFYAKDELKTELKDEADDWTVRFSIEPGSPSMATSQKWLAEDSLSSTARAEDIFHDSAVDKPSWLDPLTSNTKADTNTMDIGQSAASTKTLDVHFVCSLDPGILLPYHVAQTLNDTANVLEMRPEHMSTFQRSLHKEKEPSVMSGTRWTRDQHTFSKSGEHTQRMHSYILYTGKHDWAYPVTKLSFSHPRQYADTLPTLRQYALVNCLLQSIAPLPGTKPTASAPEPSKTPSWKDGKEMVIRDGKEIWVRSTRPKLESKLDAIMDSSKTAALVYDGALPIDVQLDTASTAATTKSCKVIITISVSASIFSRKVLASLKAQNFLRLDVEILPNGIVEVVNIIGVELEKEKMDDLKKRLARVVRCMEDVGMAVAWTIRELESF